MRFLFLLASGRQQGNSELLARRAARALSVDDEAFFLELSKYPLPYFQDHRREDYSTLVVSDNEQKLINETLLADEIVFVAPLYWYGLPASAKLYLDFWSTWMRIPGLDFRACVKGKKVSLIGAMSGADPAQSRGMIDQVRWSAEYLSMEYRGELIVKATEVGDVLEQPAALEAAATFFKS